MGLFSFIGKAVKGIAKVAVGVAKVGLGSGLIPGGGAVGRLASTLLGAKTPMGVTNTKWSAVGSVGVRGMRGQPNVFARPVGIAGPAALRASPVLPGGAVATAAGIISRLATPPASFGGSSSSGGGVRRRKKRRKATATRRKRRSGGRKLKFGSPAWRKKYMRGGKKKRRRKSS